MAKYIYTSGVPFRHAANKHLIAAFSTLGVTIQNEKWFRTTGLDKVHEEVQTAAMKNLLDKSKPAGLLVATDGWKKKYAKMGEPLMNVVGLRPFVYDIQIKCCRLG